MRTIEAGSEEWTTDLVQFLLAGGITAVPTDTVYGLAAYAWNRTGVERLFRLKNRPLDNSIPLLFSSFASVTDCGFSETALFRKLADSFWPGKLTIVLKRSPEIPEWYAAESETIAVRVPDHPVALEIIEAVGHPLAATSANRSGSAPSVKLEDITRTFGAEDDFILVNGGNPPCGEASTVIDITNGRPVLLRQGSLSFDKILEAIR